MATTTRCTWLTYRRPGISVVEQTRRQQSVRSSWRSSQRRSVWRRDSGSACVANAAPCTHAILPQDTEAIHFLLALASYTTSSPPGAAPMSPPLPLPGATACFLSGNTNPPNGTMVRGVRAVPPAPTMRDGRGAVIASAL